MAQPPPGGIKFLGVVGALRQGPQNHHLGYHYQENLNLWLIHHLMKVKYQDFLHRHHRHHLCLHLLLAVLVHLAK